MYDKLIKNVKGLHVALLRATYIRDVEQKIVDDDLYGRIANQLNRITQDKLWKKLKKQMHDDANVEQLIEMIGQWEQFRRKSKKRQYDVELIIAGYADEDE